MSKKKNTELEFGKKELVISNENLEVAKEDKARE